MGLLVLLFVSLIYVDEGVGVVSADKSVVEARAKTIFGYPAMNPANSCPASVDSKATYLFSQAKLMEGSNEILAMSLFCSLISAKLAESDLLEAGTKCLQLSTKLDKPRVHRSALVKLVKRFPEKPDFALDLGWSLLLNRNFSEAEKALESALRHKPNHVLTLVLLGLTWKLMANNNMNVTRDKLIKADIYLSKSRGSEEAKSAHGYLAGTFRRLKNFDTDVELVFEEGYKHGHFLSRWQRSVGNESKPIWNLPDTGCARQLSKIRDHWQEIRNEGLAALFEGKTTGYRDEAESLREEGLWQQLVVYENGEKVEAACLLTPKTCALFHDFPEASTSMYRGQVKFSVIHPGTHVWPHTGPTNCRLRAHLGLVVPAKTLNSIEDAQHPVRMRIANFTVTWAEGELFVIDDSFEHEVWHEGDESSGIRLVLLIDIWHPDMTEEDKAKLKPKLRVDRNRSVVFNVAGITEDVARP